MKSLFVLVGLCVINFLSIAQSSSSFKVFPLDDSTFTRRTIITSLLSEGVKIKKVKTNFTSADHAMGYFNDANRLMGIREGLVLSTGVVDNIVGHNANSSYTSGIVESPTDTIVVESKIEYKMKLVDGTGVYKGVPTGEAAAYLPTIGPGDSDLSKDLGVKTLDARVLELTFVPTADTFCYRYVFASEEYDEFVGSMFNDGFAFYLIDDKGKKINTAVVPKSKTVVSINTVNNGNPLRPTLKPKNSHLYEKYNGTQPLLFDGYTKVLDIRCKVKPGKTYKIKIVIADASDNVLDSVVLIEKESIFTYFKSYEIPYENNQSSLNNSQALKSILHELKNYPKNKLLVVGHASAKGDEENNQILSTERCSDVVNYLIKNGIKRERIIEKAVGEHMPRYNNDDLNRRVEVFIMGA